MSIVHVYSQTVADGTATSVVRPSDWNSNHNMVLNLGGNTLGTAQVSGQDIVWAGGNNVTLSANGSTVSIVGANQSVQTQASGNIGGIGYTSTTQAGSTLGITNNTAGISLAHPPFLTTYVNDLTSGRAGLGYTSTTVAGTSIGVTVNTNGISLAQPQFLTTYVNDLTSGRAGLGYTSTTQAGTTFGVTLNTNGLSMAQPVVLTTAMASNAGSNFMSASQSNNYFYTSNNTFANSTHSHGNPTLALTNLTGTTASASNGFTLSLSAAAGGVINQTGPNIAVAGSTVTSGDVYFSNSPTVTFGMAGSTITASAAGGGGAAPLFLSYQNRQLGASGSTQFTNNQLWCVPFRVAGGSISASTLQYMQSLGGTYTSAVAATFAHTMRWCIYTQDTAALSQLNSASSGSLTWQAWNSGTSSGSWAMNGSTSSSAGTGILTQVSGMRMMDIPIATTMTSGLYMLALAASTSSAGYSGLMTRYGVVVDNPMPLALGLRFGSAAATSIGYGDAGTYSVTSAGFPSTVSLSEVRQHSNLVPYFKIGAV